MKKNLFFAVMVLVALASCSGNDLASETAAQIAANDGNAIVFNTSSNSITRADYIGSDAAAKLHYNFVVEGVKVSGATSTVVFDHYNVNWVDNSARTTLSNTNNWEYVSQPKHAYGPSGAQVMKYWDFSSSQYDFIAYSAGTATADYSGGAYDNTKVQITEIDPAKKGGVDSDSDGKIDQGAYTVKGKASELSKFFVADMVTAYQADHQYETVVRLKFRSLSSKVRLALYETVSGYSVQNVVFYTDASTVATDGNAHLYTTGTEAFNEEGTYVVYYPVTGYDNKNADGYNNARLSFAPTATGGTSTVKDFGQIDDLTKATKEISETASTDKLYLGRSSSSATYFGPTAGGANHYTVVIPSETGVAMNMKVDYDLISTDGSEEVIHVTGATAQVPANLAVWKPNFAYTYIFKISDDKLVPITFDAVVMDDEVDGLQETITTVATPSITTYAKGSVVTANNEYKKNANIYVVLENAAVMTVGENANLYTVTLEDGAAQTINEASVANALVNGTKDNETSPTSWTVTDANNKKMVVTKSDLLSAVSQIAADDAPDGKAVSINGGKFTPAAAGTYVFEFNDGTAKHYKIIKVVD